MRLTVTYEGGHWILVAGDDDVEALCNSRAEAVTIGRRVARERRPSQLVIYTRRGTVGRQHRYAAARPRPVRAEREAMWRRARRAVHDGPAP